MLSNLHVEKTIGELHFFSQHVQRKMKTSWDVSRRIDTGRRDQLYDLQKEKVPKFGNKEKNVKSFVIAGLKVAK